MFPRTDEIPSRSYQYRLTIEEWMAVEFEQVTLQYAGLMDVVDKVRFFGVNGLIQRENKKISPFCFHLINSNNEMFLIIAFSIPIFQSLDNIALNTSMEYLAAILRYVLCEKRLSLSEAEVEAFNDIRRLSPIQVQKREIVPYKDFAEKIEIQLKMKVRMGIPILPVSAIYEDFKKERIQFFEELGIAKRALVNIQSNLKEYSHKIAKRYRINVVPFLFQTSLENRFNPIFLPIVTMTSSTQSSELFSLLMINKEVIKRISSNHLEVLIAHEIIFDLLKEKFSRGLVEREIFLILSEENKDNPEFLVEKEMSKFYDLNEIRESQLKIKSIVEALLAENITIMELE